MALGDAVKEVGRLMAMFRQENVTDEAISGYADRLVNVPPDVLKAAVDRIVDQSKFFPSVSEILDSCLAVCGCLPPTPAEALAIVRRADRTEVRGTERGGRGYVEKFWDWPQEVSDRTVELIQGVLSKVGEPSDMEGKPHFSWEIGFQKTFEPEAQEARLKALRNVGQLQLSAPARKALPV